MTTLQERRRTDLTTTRARLVEQREAAIAKLVKVNTALKTVELRLRRYEKQQAASAKPRQEAPPAPKPDPTLQLGVLGPAPRREDDLDIPDFLKRTQDAEMRDKAAAEAIEAEQEERKRNKARVRIEEMKAKKSGATKRMPLEGKAALAFLKD